MTRGEMKLRARSLILTNPPRPHPCLVTLALLAFIWIVNYLAQKIGGQPILIDLNAVQKLDYQNMIRIDFANAELVPTAILILFQLVDIVLSYGYIAYQFRVHSVVGTRASRQHHHGRDAKQVVVEHIKDEQRHGNDHDLLDGDDDGTAGSGGRSTLKRNRRTDDKIGRASCRERV